MNKETILKILIPVVAVVVILESVVIVTGAMKKDKTAVNEPAPTSTQGNNTSTAPKATVNPNDLVADLVFGVDQKSMEVGKKYQVTLSVFPKKNFDISATDVFVKFDPNAFDVTQIKYSEELGKPVDSKASKKQGVIFANYWITDPKGFSFANAKLVNLLSFEVTPKKTGSYQFEVATGDANGNSATILVEKSTSKVLPFASDKLNVNVAK